MERKIEMNVDTALVLNGNAKAALFTIGYLVTWGGNGYDTVNIYNVQRDMYAHYKNTETGSTFTIFACCDVAAGTYSTHS